MNKKHELVEYLLGVIQHMEREKRHRVTYTEFADVVDLPIKTVTVMFDPDDPRLPNRRNAEQVAIGLNSNRINNILGYPSLDPSYLSLMHTAKQLKPDDREEVMRFMRSLADDPKVVTVTA